MVCSAATSLQEDDDDEEDAASDHFEVEDEQYLKKLQRTARDILGGGDDDAAGDSGDDEDDWSDEEEACSTPLEELDPYLHLMQALAHMRGHMPQRYAAVVEQADVATQSGLQQLHAIAEQAKQKQAQRQDSAS